MNKIEIYQKLVPILSKQLNVESDKITNNALLKDDLGADSLDTAEIIMMIQEEFGYDIKDTELQSIKTVDDLASVLMMQGTTKN